ncbi:MAG: P-II family nitrogen regulator [Elusimicrobia bacterium]|nr:P-II family nitrogen regulator [Elusimicrobiota bacterium]
MANDKLHLITAVVQHKVGDAVISAALKAGATGATYFFAEGTGVRQSVGGSDIEIAKRAVFIVTDPGKTDSVLASVISTAHLDQPGQGFACVQEVIKAVGFVSPAGAKG